MCVCICVCVYVCVYVCVCGVYTIDFPKVVKLLHIISLFIF